MRNTRHCETQELCAEYLLQMRREISFISEYVLIQFVTAAVGTMIFPSHSKYNSGAVRQVVASLIVSLPTLHIGMCLGWLSPMSLKLKEEDSPVEKLNKEQIALLGALPLYAIIVMSFVISYVAKVLGRKIALNVIGISGIVGGLMLTFAPSKEWLYAGRVVSSITYAGITLSLMYIAETVHESIRGTMMSISTLFCNAGILASYAFGSLLTYKAYNCIFFILPTVYTVLAFPLPETPHYFVEKSKFERAKQSLMYLRAGNERFADLELEDIKPPESLGDDKVTFCGILKQKSTRKALIISTLAFAFQTLSGAQAVLNYAGLIFEEAGSAFSSETSSVITASLLVVGTFLNVILVDRYGRKPLLYVSLVGTAMSTASLTVFLYFNGSKTSSERFGWIPMVSLGSFILMYGLGLSAVPGNLMSEISPTRIRPMVGGVISVSTPALASIIVLSFPVLDDRLGLYSVFAFPTIFNVLGIVFTWCWIPETKGKSFSEIEDMLNL